MRVYLSLGSNMGDRMANLRRAVRELNTSEFVVSKVSPIYETEPLGLVNQELFLNCVLEASTRLYPVEVLQKCRRVERSLMRRRTVVNGPRTIDIDILLYEGRILRAKDLQIPHPRFHDRRFVLAPLLDIAPVLLHPVTGETVSQLLAQTLDQKVFKTDLVISMDPPEIAP